MGETVAGVRFEGPQGIESEVLCEGDVASFGRAASCRVRFAFAPIADLGVSREAGRFVIAAGRVFVEASAADGRRAIEVSAPGRPPVLVGPGDAFCPAEQEFKVVVHGETRTWPLEVTTRSETSSAARHAGTRLDDPTIRSEIVFTEAQRRVLEAYLAPIRRGRIEPATHREVADALGCHPNSAREALYAVWAALFAAAVPMPDVADKRVAVAEAIRAHRLLR